MTQSSADPAGPSAGPFRITFVPGVTPGKWSRSWEQRVVDSPLEVTPIDESDQIAVLHERRADMSFVRLPVDREGLSVIPLYREIPVVVVQTDHPIAAYNEVDVADLADERLLHGPGDVPPMTVKEAIELVANGSGIVIVPMSVARLHHRKDVTHRPVRDVADSQIGLAWLAEAIDPRIEKFIGIVRGRTERSSRAGEHAKPEGRMQSPASKPAPKKEQHRQSGKRPTRGAGRRGRDPR